MSLINTVMKLKIYLDRGRAYAGIISFAGTIFLVIAQLKMLGLNIDISTYTIPILVIGFAVITLFGWLEIKLNFFSEELNIRSWKNPAVKLQFEKFKEINDKLDKIEERLNNNI